METLRGRDCCKYINVDRRIILKSSIEKNGDGEYEPLAGCCENGN